MPLELSELDRDANDYKDIFVNQERVSLGRDRPEVVEDVTSVQAKGSFDSDGDAEVIVRGLPSRVSCEAPVLCCKSREITSTICSHVFHGFIDDTNLYLVSTYHDEWDCGSNGTDCHCNGIFDSSDTVDPVTCTVTNVCSSSGSSGGTSPGLDCTPEAYSWDCSDTIDCDTCDFGNCQRIGRCPPTLVDGFPDCDPHTSTVDSDTHTTETSHCADGLFEIETVTLSTPYDWAADFSFRLPPYTDCFSCDVDCFTVFEGQGFECNAYKHLSYPTATIRDFEFKFTFPSTSGYVNIAWTERFTAEDTTITDTENSWTHFAGTTVSESSVNELVHPSTNGTISIVNIRYSYDITCSPVLDSEICPFCDPSTTDCTGCYTCGCP